MSTQQLIKEHTKYIQQSRHNSAFVKTHSKALATLRHERLIHLLVTMFVTLFTLIIFGLSLAFGIPALLIIFVVLLIVTCCYFIYYYQLENTVVEWEAIEYEAQKKLK
ncbi:hypothetical protein JW752_01725 [Candidatus Peregrinibacteria bacterium]|nr:hypothetical protein [Candidatus Peregrinibacteria bacterium]